LSALLVSTQALAYGESDENDRPNMEERLTHVFTNQIRQQPHAWPGWNTSLATNVERGPLFMEGTLFEAARFHSDDMAANNFFEHESFDGTSFYDRVARFFSGPSGENIFMSRGPSSAREALTAWMNSDGHRVNILLEMWNRLGTGYTQGGGNRYYVQDFGRANLSERPVIPAAAIERIGGGKIRFVANLFNGGTEVEVLLDGVKIPLEHVSGPPTNATFEATANEPASCSPLVFVSGATKFPSTGALLTGADCTRGFQAEDAPGPKDRPIIDADDKDQGGCTCVAARAELAGTSLLLMLFFVVGWRRAIA
jgi:hypothetical protein